MALLDLVAPDTASTPDVLWFARSCAGTFAFAILKYYTSCAPASDSAVTDVIVSPDMTIVTVTL